MNFDSGAMKLFTTIARNSKSAGVAVEARIALCEVCDKGAGFKSVKSVIILNMPYD
jgi:hypothetical protein